MSFSQLKRRRSPENVVRIDNLICHGLWLWLRFVSQWKSMQLVILINNMTNYPIMFAHCSFLLRKWFDRPTIILIRKCMQFNRGRERFLFVVSLVRQEKTLYSRPIGSRQRFHQQNLSTLKAKDSFNQMRNCNICSLWT